jgi:hypothetical protein
MSHRPSGRVKLQPTSSAQQSRASRERPGRLGPGVTGLLVTVVIVLLLFGILAVRPWVADFAFGGPELASSYLYEDVTSQTIALLELTEAGDDLTGALTSTYPSGTDVVIDQARISGRISDARISLVVQLDDGTTLPVTGNLADDGRLNLSFHEGDAGAFRVTQWLPVDRDRYDQAVNDLRAQLARSAPLASEPPIQFEPEAPASRPPRAPQTPIQSDPYVYVDSASGLAHPDLDGIMATFERWASGISLGDYSDAFAQLSPTLQNKVGYQQFVEGNQTSTISDVVIHSISSLGSGRDLVRVTFTSHQAPGHGPHGEPCTNWILDYTLLAELSVEAKIGQLFMIFACGEDVASVSFQEADANRDLLGVATLAEAISRWQVGGVIYLGANTLDGRANKPTGNLSDPAQIARLSAEAQQVSANETGIGLLIAVDQEGGRVARVGPPATQFPAAAVFGRVGDPNLARLAGFVTAKELRALGINQVLAPVADVLDDPNNLVIGDRSFSSDPAVASTFVAAQVTGLQEGGVAATAKHFPGHGDTSIDSHQRLPIIGRDRASWDRADRLPFDTAIAAGTAVIMTGHLAMPALDPLAQTSHSVTGDYDRCPP